MPSYPIGIAYGKVVIDATNLARAQQAFISFGRTLMLTGALGIAAVAGVVKVTADFEKELDFFKAVSGATEAQMERVRQKALELGTSSPFGPRELARAFAELGKAGVRVRDIIGGVADATVQLATAGDLPLANAAEYLVNVMQTFQLEADKAVHVADLFAGAANASTVDVEDLAFSFKYAGSVAASVGVNVNDLTTAIGSLGLAGIRGSTAGTSLRRILLNLSPVSDEAATAMKELGIITEDGNNRFYDAQGRAKGLAEVFGILHEATKNLSAEQRTQALNTIFGNRAVASAAFLARQGADGFREFRREILGISAADVAEERLDNLSGALRILKSTLEATFIEAGTPAQAQLQRIVESITEAVRAFGRLSPETQENIIKMIFWTSVLLVAVGTLSFVVGKLIQLYVALRGIGQAIKFVAPLLLAVFKGAFVALAGVIGTTGAVIVAVVLVVVAILTFLYFKVDAVRNFIDGAWQWLQTAWDAVLNFFKASPGVLSRVWDSIYNAVSNFVGGVVDWFSKLPERVGGFFSEMGRFFSRLPGMAMRGMQQLLTALIGVLSRLPGTFARWFGMALTAVVNFFVQLPSRLAYLWGYMWGTLIRVTLTFGTLLFQGVRAALEAIIGFFQKLPGRVIGFLNLLWDKAYAWGTRLVNLLKNTAKSVFNAVVDWFQRLPGRVVNFLINMRDQAVEKFRAMKDRAVEAVTNLVQGVVEWFQRLPSRIATWVTRLPGRVRTWFFNIRQAATAQIGGMVDEIVNFLRELPGRMWDMIVNLADDVRGWFADIGRSAWEGFRDAITGSPRTKMEYLLLGMLDTTRMVRAEMQAEVAKMNRLAFKPLGTHMASTYKPGLTHAGMLRGTAAGAVGNGGTQVGGDTFQLTAITNADPEQIMAEYAWMKQVVVTRR